MIPVSHYEALPKETDVAVYEAVLAEYAANGARHMVAGVRFMKRALEDSTFAGRMVKSVSALGMSYRGAHSFWGAEWDLDLLDPELHRRMLENQKRVIAIAGEIGADVLVIHPGDSQFKTGDPSVAELRKRTIRALEVLLPCAEKYGVRISLENIISKADTAAEVLAILKYFDSPRLVCCYDTGHAHLMEDAPGKDASQVHPYIRSTLWKDRLTFDPEPILERLAPYVVTAHVHDNNGLLDGHLMPGKGGIDWKLEVARLERCPRLEFVQNEFDWFRDRAAIRDTVACFGRLFG